MTKERFYDILLTAVIGASIAFMQSVIAGLVAHPIPVGSPEIAASAAALLKLSSLKVHYS